MAKTNENQTKLVNLIAEGTEIQGDINTKGDIRVDGTLKGNLSTQGKVVIGESGKVEGEIQCSNSDISGEVNGKIVVKELLALKASSKIYCDIFVNKLSIEPGAKFTGNCKMDGQESPKFEGKKKKEERPTE